MADLPTLPQAAYSLDLHDGFPTVGYSAQQMYDFARSYGAEHFEPLDVRNHILERGMRKLMERLETLLDDDQFADCEDIVKRAGVEPTQPIRAMADQYEELRSALKTAHTRTYMSIVSLRKETAAALLAELDALRAATIKQSLTVQTDYAELRRAIASGNPLTVYMHREAMMTPLDGDVRELVRELDALREDARDAARYRWLSQFYVPAGERDDDWDEMDTAVLIGGQVLNAAIDAKLVALHPSKDADSGEVGNG